jgi:HME family heavy-metal exporter
MFVVLYSRYKSVTLSALIMANIPLALVGAVIGLWISGQPLSVAALDRLHHARGYFGAQRHPQGQPLHQPDAHRRRELRPQDDLARLARTSVAGADDRAGHRFALAPLLFEAERPGTEILHPVAVVIFSG